MLFCYRNFSTISLEYWMKLSGDNLASICGRSRLTSFTTFCNHRFLRNHQTVISFHLCGWTGKSVWFHCTLADRSMAWSHSHLTTMMCFCVILSLLWSSHVNSNTGHHVGGVSVWDHRNPRFGFENSSGF